MKETFILSHDFSRLGSWLPGPMSFTQHSGRNMWVSDQEGVGGTCEHASGSVHILLFLGYQIIRWTLKMSFPVSYCPTYSSFLEMSPRIHPVMPFTSPGHLSIQYTDKTSRSSFTALGK